MTNFYVKNIIKGKKLWTEVPEYWFEDVKNELIAQGYTLNPDGTVSIG